ncbi:MAG: bacteriophage holin [Chlamydiia bacterium]|nr:bacteriophage holin [Chlamydiia bacterium]
MQLNPSAFGFAAGIVWGLAIAITALVSTYTGYASLFLHMFSEIYPGFEVSLVGAGIGLVYGFVDGFIGGYVVAWLYNRFA